jgi:hypothetical protein
MRVTASARENGEAVRHSCRRSQRFSIRGTERLADAGKTNDPVNRRAPWKTGEAVESAVLG